MDAMRAAPSGTRERLLVAAIALMRRSGLSGSGINEIVRESGAPKGSVYHFFPGGKRQIVATALDAYALEVARFIDAALAKRRSPPMKVKALFEAFAERIEEAGFLSSCAAGTVCLDLDAELDALRVVVARAFATYIDAIAPHFAPLGRERSRSFAGLLLSAIEGAYVRARADRSGAPFREAGAWLAKLVEEA